MAGGDSEQSEPAPAALLLMPGKHSEQALAARRQRAIGRGYVVAKASDQYGRIEVRPSVAGRVRAMALSIELQEEHNSLTGAGEPVARAATRKARPFLARQQYRQAMERHDAANLAKHHWNGDSLGQAE